MYSEKYSRTSINEIDIYKIEVNKEHYELNTRLRELKKIIELYKEGKLHFEVKTPIEIFEYQAEIMEQYLNILRVRAALEDIPLLVDHIDE